MLGTNNRRAVLQTYEAMLRAGMSVEDVIDVLTPVMYRAAVEGSTLASSELARMLARMTGEPIGVHLAAPVTLMLDRERVAEGLRTTLADADGAARHARLARLAYSDPIAVAQDQITNGMKESRIVDGYIRVLDSDACELCGWLWQEGRVFPAHQPMHQHPGCVCTARPVLKTVEVDPLDDELDDEL